MFSMAYNISDSGMLVFHSWPNGLPYLEQDNALVMIFALIREVFIEDQTRKREKLAKKQVRRRR